MLLHHLWSRSGWWLFLLVPVELLYRMLWWVLRAYYQVRPAKPKVHLPIIVVGSIIVGGCRQDPGDHDARRGLITAGF